jgi:hypothetical protein
MEVRASEVQGTAGQRCRRGGLHEQEIDQFLAIRGSPSGTGREGNPTGGNKNFATVHDFLP